MNKIYNLNLPNINYVGVNSSQKIAEIVKEFNAKNAFIVTDIDLPTTGIPDMIKYQLDENNIRSTLWSGANPNPLDINIEEGVKAFKECDHDIIIGLGGGSSIDCAKGIRILLDNGGIIEDYEGIDKIKNKKTRLIAVATTAGTSSEITNLAVITNTKIKDIKYKMGVLGWKVTPDVSINDPLLTVSLNKFYTAGTGMDIFTHALEAILSINSTPISDLTGLKSINLVTNWLKLAVEDGNNIEARTNMVYAVFLAGMSFNVASLGISHSLAHSIGTYYDLHHGMCNALLLPAACRFNLIESAEKLSLIAEAMGIDTTNMSTTQAANKAIEGIEKLLIDINAPHKFREMGVGTDKIERMSIDAYNDFCAGTNPRKATIEDFKKIYESII